MNEIYVDIRKESEWLRNYFDGDFVSIDKLLNCLDDLHCENEKLKEDKLDIEQVIERYEKREHEILDRVKEFWS